MEILREQFGHRGWTRGRFGGAEQLRLSRLLLHFEMLHLDDGARVQAREDSRNRADLLPGLQFAPMQIRE